MNDVARLAGVSIKTVSRVVNDEPAVRSDTAARVLAAIDQLGFRRHLGARNLRQGSTTATVGLIVEDVGNPFYSALTRAIERIASSHGRRLVTGSSEEDSAREQQLAVEFCARRMDGIVVVPAGAQHGYLVPEMRAGIPVVFADRPAGDIAADTVLVDNLGGTAAAVTHLAKHGHRRIGFIADSPDIYTAAERLRGFREGCARAGIRFDERLVALRTPTERGVGETLRAFTNATNPATAIVAGNNRVTVHLLRAMAHASQRPAIVGFDDFELADLLDPPVSVVAHDVGAMGEAAANLLFARIGGEQSGPRRIVLPTRLIARGSGEMRPA